MHRCDISTIRYRVFSFFFFLVAQEFKRCKDNLLCSSSSLWLLCYAQAAVNLLRSKMNCRQGGKS